ncbi:hypothetical protein [Salinispora arenicola]|uniref:hypothetical protein n=1 Tax=Salinispora arenicola TaxID=168697 RepID=UPI0003A3AFBD|nr:hypothetical protein [Salinispora arenicola]SCL35837.1 hypothetical protein GA0070615_2899 [Micromonospora aurantiaca]
MSEVFDIGAKALSDGYNRARSQTLGDLRHASLEELIRMIPTSQALHDAKGTTR